jgi:hypothetical protein
MRSEGNNNDKVSIEVIAAACEGGNEERAFNFSLGGGVGEGGWVKSYPGNKVLCILAMVVDALDPDF